MTAPCLQETQKEEYWVMGKTNYGTRSPEELRQSGADGTEPREYIREQIGSDAVDFA
jgi:hypothetical protein